MYSGDEYYGDDVTSPTHRPMPRLPRVTEREKPAPYIQRAQDVYEWSGSQYRWYCTMAAWPYSPAAKAGNELA